MDITFANEATRKLFADPRKLRAEFGADPAGRILRRLDDLRAAKNLEEMRHLPGRCHELTGDLDGLLSIDLKHPYRLLFAPEGEDLRKEDGGLDWSKVTSIQIARVEDTHRG